MDEMKLVLKTPILKEIVSKIVEKTISKKFNTDVDLHIKQLDIVTDDGKCTVKMSFEAELNQSDITSVVKKLIEKE